MSKNLKVIGITGFKRTGKSTFARTLRDAHPNTFIYSFAKPLKEICHILFGATEDHWYGDLKAEPLENWSGTLKPFLTPTPRQLMQYVGTEMFRHKLADNFWTQVAYRYICDAHVAEGFDLCVVDDVRFDNEAHFLLDNFDATIVKLRRCDDLYKPDGDVHESERGINHTLVDYGYNVGALADYPAISQDLLRRIGVMK